MNNLNLLPFPEVDGIAPLPSLRDLLHLDGHCFIGDAGLLAVALTGESLARLRRSATPTHWLLALEQPTVAAAASALPGEVFWVCSRPPEERLGPLAGDVLGVWRDGATAVVRRPAGGLRLQLSVVPPDSAMPLHLARVFVDAWMGHRHHLVPDSWLASAAAVPQPRGLIAA